VIKETLALQVQPDRTVQLVLRVKPVPRAQLVLRVLKARQEQLVLKVLRVKLGLQEPRVQLVLKEMPVLVLPQL
jgi:hypothetical protein